MADTPVSLTRAELQEIFKTPKAIKVFENVQVVAATIPKLSEDTIATAAQALAAATTAIGLANNASDAAAAVTSAAAAANATAAAAQALARQVEALLQTQRSSNAAIDKLRRQVEELQSILFTSR
ncbi:MAG: hypothetical protein ACRYGK_15495 [Janthinobacterium lividum]